MISNKNYDCQLYTLDGVKAAIAKLSNRQGHNGDCLVKVTAKDGTFAIYVNQPTAERKFWNDENPTFYAC